jgi:endonuclease YncB( thermonuclease family)
VDGKNVNYEMIEAGLAEAYRGKHPRDFDPMPYRQAELQARNASRGMWSLGDEYISPKDWRKMQRGK